MFDTFYAKIADDLVANGYCILESVLPLKLNQKLCELCKDESAFAKAGISSGQKVHIDNSKRSASIRWLSNDAAAQSDFLAFMEGLALHLNRHLYLGLKFYESHFAIYDVGDFYEKHYDAFSRSKNRVLTTVYYLNESWSQADAGELLIFDETQELLKRIPPKMGTLVVFLSEKFPHEVLPARKKRHSIAGWFRVDEKLF